MLLKVEPVYWPLSSLKILFGMSFFNLKLSNIYYLTALRNSIKLLHVRLEAITAHVCVFSPSYVCKSF